MEIIPCIVLGVLVSAFIGVVWGFVHNIVFYDKRYAEKEAKKKKIRDEKQLYEDVAYIKDRISDMENYLKIRHIITAGYEKRG